MHKQNLYIVFLIIGLYSCSENKPAYKTPIIEELNSDSIFWQELEESQKLGEYFVYGGEIFCGEVAYNSYPLKGIERESFQVLANTKYAKDKNHVLYPLTTICVDGMNWGNCHAVEYVIAGADPNSFKYIGDEYAMDKMYVYFRGVKIPNTKPREFESLSQGYAKDSMHVYFRGAILKEADRKTFVVAENGIGRDTSNIFCYGTIQNEVKTVPNTK